MKSKLFVGAVVSGLALFLCAETAHAQWRGGRMGGYNNGGYGRAYNYGYSPFNYNYGYTTPYNNNSYYNSPYNNSNGYYGYRQYGNNYPGTAYYSNIPDNSYVPSTTQGNYQSFYSGAASNDRVRLHVVMPSPDARLWVENTATQGSGWERNFDSPPLTAGQVYTYTLRASWFANGRDVTQEKQVDVRPGEAVTVRFDTAPASATP